MSHQNIRNPHFIGTFLGGCSLGMAVSMVLLSGMAWSSPTVSNLASGKVSDEHSSEVSSGLAETGSFHPEKVHLADTKKTDLYYTEGLISGGDQAIQEVVIKDIRRANNPGGFDRIVIDLEGNRNGESAELQRPPYYQVAIQPKEKRLTLTITGHPNLAFNAKKVLQTFKKSALIQNVVLLPKVEDHLWTFSMTMQAGVPVEVFELTHPVRVILDLKHKKSEASHSKKN